MQQVVPPIPIVQKILGEQKTAGGVPHRFSTYCMRVERSEGTLLYHTLTGELLLLSSEEASLLEKLPGSVPARLEALVARWFLRPEDADDMAWADQTREIATHLGMRAEKKREALTGYTIFTTMACNARCFYCFETGWNKSTMAEQTALDAAKYIAAHCGGKAVRLKWFGGEPLMNSRAIDIITDSLRQQGVEFRSTMTSNGSLFDEALVERARDAWNLKLVQITLDGTEEIYNQRKAYVNPQGSPYRRVLRNIGLLLDAGIAVKVRLNMDENNERDLYALLDELAERFGGKPGFDVYLTVIWENAGRDPHSYTEEQRRSYAEKIQSLQAHAFEKKILSREPLRRTFKINACSADNDSYTSVLPNGQLARCESCKNGAIWGSIYSDEADAEVIREWKVLKQPEEACRTCPVYPQCRRPQKCPGWPERCSPIERLCRENVLRRAAIGACADWRTAGQD